MLRVYLRGGAFDSQSSTGNGAATVAGSNEAVDTTKNTVVPTNEDVENLSDEDETKGATKNGMKRNIGAVFIAAVVGLLGYGLAEGIMYGNFLTPLIKLPISALQPIGCGTLYILVGFAFDRIKLKSQLVKTLEER